LRNRGNAGEVGRCGGFGGDLVEAWVEKRLAAGVWGESSGARCCRCGSCDLQGSGEPFKKGVLLVSRMGPFGGRKSAFRVPQRAFGAENGSFLIGRAI
jgi:hypothetical protein